MKWRKINGWEVVYNEGSFKVRFVVYEVEDRGIIEWEWWGVDILGVRIVGEKEDFRVFGVVDVE